MPITEQDLEAAKKLLRAEFKSNLDAALQELSVQITESHNRVVEVTSKRNAEGLATELTALKKANENFHQGFEERFAALKEHNVLPVAPIGESGDQGGVVAMRLEKQHLYLDDLADRLGQPRMKVN